jgi:hypothetical protein
MATLQVLERLLQSKGKDRTGEDYTLEELLGQDAEEKSLSHDQFSLTGVRGSSNMAALNRSIATRPTCWSQQFDANMATALGGEVHDSLWSAREYGERRIQWGNQEHLHRMWATMSELHRLDRRGERDLLAAKLRQYMKATELAGRSQGDWQIAWTLTGLPDPRPSNGSVKETLCHPAELAAAAAMTKEQLTLETALGRRKGESQQKPWWKQGRVRGGKGGQDGGATGGGGEQKGARGKGSPALR